MFQLLEGQRVCDTRKNGRIFEITHAYIFAYTTCGRGTTPNRNVCPTQFYA